MRVILRLPVKRRRVLLASNPARAAFVERPEEYKWSSAAAHLRLAKDRYSLLDKNFWTENGGAEGWADLLAAPEDVLDTRLLRRCTYAGQPFGEEYYVVLFEEQFRRVWRKWGFDVPSHSMASPIGRANHPQNGQKLQRWRGVYTSKPKGGLQCSRKSYYCWRLPGWPSPRSP